MVNNMVIKKNMMFCIITEEEIFDEVFKLAKAHYEGNVSMAIRALVKEGLKNIKKVEVFE